jgi:hypothetical protein
VTLDEAFEKLQTEFGVFDTEGKPGEQVETASGGELKTPEKPPGLYLSRELAVASWYRCTAEMLREKDPATWRVIGNVNVDKWRITVADEKNTHRIAEDRYSVSATVGLMFAAEQPKA